MNKKRSTEEEHILPIRFPVSLWSEIGNLADEEGRSLNKEVIHMAREYIARHRKVQSEVVTVERSN